MHLVPIQIANASRERGTLTFLKRVVLDPLERAAESKATVAGVPTRDSEESFLLAFAWSFCVFLFLAVAEPRLHPVLLAEHATRARMRLRNLKKEAKLRCRLIGSPSRCGSDHGWVANGTLGQESTPSPSDSGHLDHYFESKLS